MGQKCSQQSSMGPSLLARTSAHVNGLFPAEQVLGWVKCLLLDIGFPGGKRVQSQHRKGRQRVTKQIIPHLLLQRPGSKQAYWHSHSAPASVLWGPTQQWAWSCGTDTLWTVLLALCYLPKYMHKGLLWICTHPEGMHAACTASVLLHNHRLMHRILLCWTYLILNDQLQCRWWSHSFPQSKRDWWLYFTKRTPVLTTFSII